jgi:lipoate-protein ligase A
MQYLDLTLPSAAENLALDEALLLDAEADRGTEILRFWEWSSPTAILGAGCRLAEDVDEAACNRHEVPILRRSSGGGTVLLDTGCLCYTLVLAYDRDRALGEIRSSFCFILGRIRDRMLKINPGIELAGTSDLALGGKKFSGNSQQRKRNYLLHHGTILFGFDARLADRYLRMPARQPDYRRQRPHGEFLINLPTDSESLKCNLLGAWDATIVTDSWPQELVRDLVETKYNQVEWTRRR